MNSAKARYGGNFFEDFEVGQAFRHAVPRTVTDGDVSLYTALTGARFAINSSTPFAQGCGLDEAPLDDLLVFNMIFGRTVPEISVNALRSLGYAELRFGAYVYSGDTLRAESTVIGLREVSDRRSGILWVRTSGFSQRGECVVEFVRWAKVARRTSLSPIAPAREPSIPKLAAAVAPEQFVIPPGLNGAGYDVALTGGPRRWGDYARGERIDHIAGVTIEDAEHQMAARLFNNSAHAHFDRRRASGTSFGKRLAYSGYLMSLARGLTFDGLANAFRIAAINGWRTVGPLGGGDTLYAWSEILDLIELPGRRDIAALRVRTVGVRDQDCHEFPDKSEDGNDHPAVAFDFDYTVLMPR
jgi:2-methylfumaryl-CoA hydratase